MPPLNPTVGLPHLFVCVQCHTNLVAVWNELEEEPNLLGSATNLAGLVGTVAASLAPGNGAAAAQPEESDSDAASAAAVQSAAAEEAQGGSAAASPQPEQRVMLLHNPRRRFLRPAQRTPKLLGMVQIVGASSEWPPGWLPTRYAWTAPCMQRWPASLRVMLRQSYQQRCLDWPMPPALSKGCCDPSP
jgi:hypothetical protein